MIEGSFKVRLHFNIFKDLFGWESKFKRTNLNEFEWIVRLFGLMDRCKFERIWKKCLWKFVNDMIGVN